MNFKNQLGRLFWRLILPALMILLSTMKSDAIQIGIDLGVATEYGGWFGATGTYPGPGPNPYNQWTWTVDGASVNGQFLWECGNLIDGESERSQSHLDMYVKPDTAYSASINGGSQICDAYWTVGAPSCYDVYVQDPLVSGSHTLRNGYPQWREGYVTSYTLNKDPNDPQFNTTSFGMNFFLLPNNNAEPAAKWSIKTGTGSCESTVSQLGHYSIANDGASSAAATVENTTYPVTFAFAVNPPPLGFSLVNTANGATFTAGTNKCTIEIYAVTADPNPCLVTNFFFDVGSDGCQSCGSGGTTCDVTPALKSLDIKFSLGKSIIGGGNAFMEVEAQVPDASLGTPQSIQYNFIRPDVQVVNNSPGWIRQIISNDRVIDINTNTASSYYVNFYRISDVLGYSATNNLYSFKNAPYRAVLVYLVGGDTNHVKIMDTLAADSDYYWTNGGWSLVTGNGLRTESLLVTTNGTTYTKTRLIKNASGGIDHQSTEQWQNFSYGARLMCQTTGAGATMQVETNSYTADGMLQQSVHADGSWDIYAYDSQDRQIGHYSPFLNVAPTTNATLCRYAASTYDAGVVSGSGDDGSQGPYTPRLVVNYVLNNEVGRTYYVVKAAEEDEIHCVNVGAAWNAVSNLVTVTYTYPDVVNLGKPWKILRPDGTMQMYLYERAVALPVPVPTFGSPNAAYEKTTVWTGQPDAGTNNVIDGTMDETWTDSLQNDVLHRVTDVASQIITDQEKYTYDDHGHCTNTVYLNRTSLIKNYDCCTLASSMGRDGTVTSYGYDALKRRTLTVLNGITSSNILNANGDVLGTVRYGTDGSAMTNGSSSYDTAGQLTSSTDALGNTTVYTNYFDGSGQWIKVTTYTDLSTRVETYAKDGSLLKVTGTAVLGVRDAYGVESESGTQRLYRQEIKLDASGADTTEWTKTYMDLLGREYKTVFASASGTPASQSFYNLAGQMVKQIDPDGVTTLYQYNAKGESAYTAIDMNTNGVIDFAGNDRITSTVDDVVSTGNNVNVNRVRTYVWNAANVNSSNLISTTMSSVDGLQTWNIIWNNGNGLTNYTQTAYDPLNGYMVITTVAPDKSTSISTSQYGRVHPCCDMTATGCN